MVERFQSPSRNDHERGMIAEANPTRLCFTLRDASLINEFSLVSILMQHLTLLTILFLSHYHTSLQILELQFSIIKVFLQFFQECTVQVGTAWSWIFLSVVKTLITSKRCVIVSFFQIYSTNLTKMVQFWLFLLSTR